MRVLRLLGLAIALAGAALPAMITGNAIAGDGDPIVKQDKGK